MLEELTLKEALTLIAERHPEPVNFVLEYEKKKNNFGVTYEDTCIFAGYEHFYIEVPDKFRYMETQEYLDWLTTIGYKNHQIHKKDEGRWSQPTNIYDAISKYEYRTVRIIDGKVAYGWPQEFLVKENKDEICN